MKMYLKINFVANLFSGVFWVPIKGVEKGGMVKVRRTLLVSK